ncbi:MAG: ParB/RepB/Spo0J family partition protein [Isosphaeraceae bacterium]|nr:ParB/RepB/Spo0J family partition protein [Isosphaeraceae bacterium]
MAKLREELAAKFGGAMQHSLGVGQDDTASAAATITPGNTRSKFDGTRTARDVRLIPVEQITPDPSQPREEFDEEAIKRLAHSLDTRGQLQPIRVRWSEDEGKWMIIAGERRWRAAKQSRIVRELACIVVDRAMSSEEILHDQLVENCLREDLQPIEQAKAFRRVMEAKGWSATRMAEELGISTPTVTRALALLRLPEDIQEAVDVGALPPRSAAEIASLDDPEERRQLALETMTHSLTRDQVTEEVQKRKMARGVPRKGRKPRKSTLPSKKEEDVTPGNTRGNTRQGYKLADGTSVIIQGPRQSSPASRLAALREAITLAEAELVGQGGDR